MAVMWPMYFYPHYESWLPTGGVAGSNLAAGPPSTNVLQVPKIDNFSYLGFQYQYIQRDHNAKISNRDIKQYFVILFNSYLIIVDIFMLKFHF